LLFVVVAPGGFRYAGDWAAGNKHGKGVFAFPDGECYRGEYVEGRMHGLGVYFFANGDV